jgi:hypothetical protein
VLQPFGKRLEKVGFYPLTRVSLLAQPFSKRLVFGATFWKKVGKRLEKGWLI